MKRYKITILSREGRPFFTMKGEKWGAAEVEAEIEKRFGKLPDGKLHDYFPTGLSTHEWIEITADGDSEARSALTQLAAIAGWEVVLEKLDDCRLVGRIIARMLEASYHGSPEEMLEALENGNAFEDSHSYH